jgi:hypothetical protein
MLAGEPVPLPFKSSLTGTLSGAKDEVFEHLLSEGVAVVVQPD